MRKPQKKTEQSIALTNFEALGVPAAWDYMNNAMDDRFLETLKEGPSPKLKVGENGDVVFNLEVADGIPDISPNTHMNGLARIYAMNREAAISHITQVQANASGASISDYRIKEINGTFAIIDELRAQDALEGLLISQMASVYSAAMDFLGRARKATDIKFIELYSKQSAKLLQVFNQQMLALNKHRKGNKQTVIVKHVHVHEGGQAVIDSNISTAGANDG